MRPRLGRLLGYAVRVTGIITKFGKRPSDVGVGTVDTMAISDVHRITYEGNVYPVASHLWIDMPDNFWSIVTNPFRDNRVELTGIVSLYTRRNGSQDYTLRDISDFCICKNASKEEGVKA
jgi:hypothetical protein